MHVEIETLSSRVSVADGAAPHLEMIEKIVAIVLARMKDEHSDKESTKREQEIRPHMTDPEPY